MGQGLTPAAQEAANQAVDGVQKLVNEVVDGSEHVAGGAIGSVADLLRKAAEALDAAKETLVGKQ